MNRNSARRRVGKNNKSKESPDAESKVGSFSYLLGVPTAALLNLVLLVTQVMLILQPRTVSLERVGIFLLTAVGSALIFFSGRRGTISTLIHELKHTAAVALTGNRVKRISVTGETGYVTYEMYRGREQFGPFIMLAPYFLPLLSVPALIAALIVEEQAGSAAAALLGMFCAIDLLTGIGEIHPHQTDLTRMIGGRWYALLFIWLLNLLWLQCCLLWAAGGRRAYVELFFVVAAWCRSAAQHLNEKR